MFEHFKQLWMGIWQHIHTVTTTEDSPDLGKFSEIIYDENVEMIPLRYRWGSPGATEKLAVRTMELMVPALSKYWAQEMKMWDGLLVKILI